MLERVLLGSVFHTSHSAHLIFLLPLSHKFGVSLSNGERATFEFAGEGASSGQKAIG